MKLNISPLVFIAAAAVVTPLQSKAVTITQTANATLSVNQDYTSLPFKTFNSSLGTLNSVTFTIDSASIAGSLIFSSDASSTVRGFSSQISVWQGVQNDNSILFNGLSSDLVSSAKSLTVSNTSLPQVVPANTGTTFTLSGGQYNIPSNSPLTQTIGGYLNIKDFIGNSVTDAPTFILNLTLTTTGSINGTTVTQDYSGISSTANVSLKYDYTPTPVPEPSTYGLALGGLALAAVAVRRRKLKS